MLVTVNLAICRTPPQKLYKADIIICGGTSAAITAAVQAKRMAKSVIVVSPDKHIGGLSSSGLGFTDTSNKEVISGLSREFYHRIFMHYADDSAWQWQEKSEYGNKGQGTPAIDGYERTICIFEPHAAEAIFKDSIKENNINILLNEWLNRETGVKKSDGNIISITTLSGKIFGVRCLLTLHIRAIGWQLLK